jgi:hypothetical protein
MVTLPVGTPAGVPAKTFTVMDTEVPWLTGEVGVARTDTEVVPVPGMMLYG